MSVPGAKRRVELVIPSFVEKMKRCNSNPGKYGPVTIAVLGDSVTQGCFELFRTGEDGFDTSYDPAYSYINRLKEKINYFFPRVYLNIINGGISGDNAPGGFARMERDVMAFHPDLLIVSFGLNDCGAGEEGLSRYTDAIRSIVRRARQDGTEVIFFSDNAVAKYVDPRIEIPSLRNIAAGCARNHELGWDRRYFEEGGRAAAEEGAVFCDFNARWMALEAAGADMTARLCNHVNHPERTMHEWVAGYLFDTIFFD